MDIQKRRAKRLAELVEEYEPLPECMPDWAKPNLGRYLLIRYATGDGDARWFTVCGSLDAAVEHWEHEIDPFQWILRAVVDLDSGDQMSFAIRLTFDPVVAKQGKAEG